MSLYCYSIGKVYYLQRELHFNLPLQFLLESLALYLKIFVSFPIVLRLRYQLQFVKEVHFKCRYEEFLIH